jgi:hypothetical protein
LVFNRIISWLFSATDALKFLAIISVTVVITYSAPPAIKALWYIVLLASYFISENEPLWLAVFLATTDGFAGFMGLYEVKLTLLPGLPAVEIAQLYIILSVVKAVRSGARPVLFYNKYLQVLFIYLLFNIIWGQMMGLTGGLNVYFRVIKGLIPMFLFYSIPRLFLGQEMYEKFFRIIFVIVLFAFAAQLFNLISGTSPTEALGISLLENQDDKDEFRVFYSTSSVLLGLFGALYYLNRRRDRLPDRLVMFSVIFSALAMAVLSATRGWIISFSLIILLSFVFTKSLRSARTIALVIISLPIVLWALSKPVIHEQIIFAQERLGTLEAISEGDLSARGTLQRLDYRSQRALGGWKENPIFGWGLSDKGYDYWDDHVGNQSLLATSGIIGFVLLNGFIAWFIYMFLSLYFRNTSKPSYARSSLLLFAIFLAGWFIIHSSSGQHFNYNGMPEKIIPQTIFFSFGALQYQLTLRTRYVKKI